MSPYKYATPRYSLHDPTDGQSEADECCRSYSFSLIRAYDVIQALSKLCNNVSQADGKTALAK